MLRNAVSRTTLKAVGQGGLGGSSSHAEGMHPNLGLHNAAATGNIGLVKFALENGQSANSNLNGILPLHAACSGGSEQSVRMLIFHGADVNAPRLKAKGSSGGPGAEGSTPLHFAAANGHLEIVRMLLEAGARPAAADKDGVAPEALATSAGNIECANLIRSWISAYGSNGLAGMVESRETVSGDVTLGPAGYIRYAASGPTTSPGTSRGSQPAVTSSSAHNTSRSTTPQLSTSTSASRSSATHSSSLLTANSISDPHQSSSSLKSPQAPASPAPPSATATPTSPNPTTLPTGYSPYDYAASVSNAARSPSGISASMASGSVATAAAGGSVRESKRRPSIPSILGKAAHPAASLRAALGTGSSSQASGSVSQASSSRYLDQSYDATTASPGKKHSKLVGKRSLTNILKKATGSNTGSTPSSISKPAMPSSSSSYFGDVSAASSTSMLSGGAINMDALAKPGRTSGRSSDYNRPPVALRRNTAGNSLSEGQDVPKSPNAARTALPTSRSDAVALDQQRKLRTASSSSSLSAPRDQFLADSQIRRARAGSNEQAATHFLPPPRANASLDLLRPTGHLGVTNISPRTSADKMRAASGQDSRIDAMKRAAGQSSTSGPSASLQQAGNALPMPHLGGRDRSVSGSSSQSAGTTDNERSQTHSHMDVIAAEGDLQEFLDHPVPGAGTRNQDNDEHHDSHRLPAGLRTMTALRQQNAREAGDASTTSADAAALNAPDARNDDGTRANSVQFNRTTTRDRSGSHTSAVSSGSQSGSSSRGLDAAGPRNSPGLSASYQALSVAEENGLTSSIGRVSGAGSSSTSLGRAGRSASVAESVASQASSSSLRSNHLSAAEQAQAILNHETPYASDGPDGTSTSLAAQLAAYGEALAQERRRAGDARSGPSPNLSTRGSNAALRSKLPSVTEDQSPSRPTSHGTRSASISDARTPNYPATAAQSYNRRVSRRPHSSEGRQSQEGGKRGTFSPVSTTISPPPLPATDKFRLGQNRMAATDDSKQGGARIASPEVATASGLASPPQATSVQSLEMPASVAPPGLVGAEVGAIDRRETGAAPSMPTKGQPRRRHEPVMFNPAAGLPFVVSTQSDDTTSAAADVDDDDEDDPKTPVLGANKALSGKFSSSPRSLHQHSPSLPMGLASYDASRHEALPEPALTDRNNASATANLSLPLPPPRKESINAPSTGGHLGPSDSSPRNDTRMLSPDPATWSAWRAEGAASVRDDDTGRDRAMSTGSSSRGEGFKRPSISMRRTATSSSTHSQTPSHTSLSGTEDYGHGQRQWSIDEGTSEQPSNPSTTAGTTGTGKRGLVRNLLNKATGSS